MGPDEHNPTMTDIHAFHKLNDNNYYVWSQQMKSTLEACMLWIGHIEFDVPPPTRPPSNPPKKSKTLAPPTIPTWTTGRASAIGTAPAASSSLAPAWATSVPIPGRMKTTLSDSDDEDDTFLPEYVAWERKWERYHKWVQNDCAAMGLIHNTLNPSQWPHVHGTSTAEGMWDNFYQLYFIS